MQYLDYNERKQRGTLDFPIEFHHVDEKHPQYAMPFHWHVEYEIIRILKGKFVISIDEKEFHAKQGDVLFINGGSLHGGIPDNCIYECIVFDMNMLSKRDSISQKYVEQIMNHTILFHEYFGEASEEIHDIVWQLFDSMGNSDYGYQFITLGCLYQVLGILFGNGEYVAESPQKHKRILQLKQVLEVIENSYANPITLEQLSKAAGMSPKYFCRFFQEMTHKSPFDYLNYYRIERACYQLQNTDTSITEIAYNCGFNDLSYFIKTFKKYKGTTPAKYRRASN